MSALDDSLAASYLERLAVDAEKGGIDPETLAELQRAHLAVVPYENLDILRGEPPPIDPVECARRIVAGRGGYCFHLNGAFAGLLEWLGVDVTRHVSGVQGRAAAEPPGASGNHLGLTTRFGPSDPTQRWLVDVGLGDGPARPLPLVPGTYAHEGFAYRLGTSPLVPGGWRLDHDPRGAFILVDFAPEPASTADFETMHTKLSTSADSGFVRIAAVLRRPAAGLETLRGCVFSEWSGDTVRERDIDSRDDWWGLVLDRFGLAYAGLSALERDSLWRQVRSVHEAWDAAGRP